MNKKQLASTVLALFAAAALLAGGYAAGTRHSGSNADAMAAPALDGKVDSKTGRKVHNDVRAEFRFEDGSTHLLGPGGVARVSASTHRGVRNAGDDDAIIVVAGGKDGYVGRDGQAIGGSGHGPPGAA